MPVEDSRRLAVSPVSRYPFSVMATRTVVPSLRTPFVCFTGGELREIVRRRPDRLPIAGTGGRPELSGEGEPAIQLLSIAKGTVRTVPLDPRLIVPRSVDTVLREIPVAEPEPRLELRIRAVYAFDKGSAAPMTIDELRERVSTMVERANLDLAGTGFRFVFFPRHDAELREDSTLRRDVDLSDETIADLESGKINEADGDLLLKSSGTATWQHRNAVAGEQPNKLMWLFSRQQSGQADQ